MAEVEIGRPEQVDRLFEDGKDEGLVKGRRCPVDRDRALRIVYGRIDPARPVAGHLRPALFTQLFGNVCHLGAERLVAQPGEHPLAVPEGGDERNHLDMMLPCHLEQLLHLRLCGPAGIRAPQRPSTFPLHVLGFHDERIELVRSQDAIDELGMELTG